MLSFLWLVSLWFRFLSLAAKIPNLPIARSVGFVWLSFAAFYLTRKVEHVW
jgi:hypothetical protein